MLLHLARSNFRVHKIRAALTIAAIAMSVSLVVSVTSGYSSVYAAATRVLATHLGTVDAQISRKNAGTGGVKPQLVEQIRKDALVGRVDLRLEVEGRVLDSQGTVMPGWAQFTGIRRPQDVRVESLRKVEGAWFNQSDSAEAVIDQVTQERLKLKLGDMIAIPSGPRKLELRVVGVVHKPAILAMAMPTVYVPLETLQNFILPPEKAGEVSRVMIDLAPGADLDAFAARWKQTLAEVDPNLHLRLATQIRRDMDNNLLGLQMLSFLGGTFSMVAATFIVFSALSMGVAERQRTLGMLRAIGAFRSHLGGLVVVEGWLLAVAGVLIGIPLGILWIKILAWMFDEVFIAGGVVNWLGVTFAVVGSILTALAASLLPAFSAMRASPLEAMSPLASAPRNRGMVISAIVGVALMSLDPLILFGPFGRSFQFWGHFFIGLPGVMLGCFLLAPLAVWTMERVLAPIVAPIFGVRSEMLRQQLSGGGIWRAAGTCAALMVGLSILIVTQTQGASAIRSWKLPDRFPDAFIFASSGLGVEEQKKLLQVPGIRSDQVMPIAIVSPQFGSGMFAIVGAAIMPDATMYFGVDPDLAFKMMDLDFRDGNPADAERLLKLGKHVVVTQEFQQIKGIGVGDTISLRTNKGNVDFTVAGVVWSPGIDVITTMQDLGSVFDKRTAASLFGSLDDAREYFGVTEVKLFAANLQPGVDKKELLAHIDKQISGWGFQIGDVRSIKYSIQRVMSRMLLLVSTIAYAALAVASLGVTNTIMASIRSRRWHFGILRSIGVTRGQLLRLVLAEAFLLGLLGVGLGLLAGSQLVLDARQAWDRWIGFPPPLVVPWGTLLFGVTVVMALSILASLWPAVHVARSEPLELLQAGRAAV